LDLGGMTASILASDRASRNQLASKVYRPSGNCSG